MIKIFGKEYRNPVEQIAKNQEDIETLKNDVQENTEAIASMSQLLDSTAETASDAMALAETNEHDIGTLDGEVAALDSGKQDKLTAGSNVTILSNVISATDSKYDVGTGLLGTVTPGEPTEFSVDFDTVQHKLTAGTNITISGNVISASGGGGGSKEYIVKTNTGTDILTGIKDGDFYNYTNYPNGIYFDTAGAGGDDDEVVKHFEVLIKLNAGNADGFSISTFAGGGIKLYNLQYASSTYNVVGSGNFALAVESASVTGNSYLFLDVIGCHASGFTIKAMTNCSAK